MHGYLWTWPDDPEWYKCPKCSLTLYGLIHDTMIPDSSVRLVCAYSGQAAYRNPEQVILAETLL